MGVLMFLMLIKSKSQCRKKSNTEALYREYCSKRRSTRLATQGLLPRQDSALEGSRRLQKQRKPKRTVTADGKRVKRRPTVKCGINNNLDRVGTPTSAKK